MSKRRILFVIGTRPEIIKTAPVIAAFKKDRSYRTKVCFSGQHQALAMQMIKEFGIIIDFDLGLMRRAQSLNDLTSRSMAGFEKCFTEAKPDLVMVQGDTTTAFCASLAAFYMKIPVGHIEAGLRTHDKFRPYPEESNRVMISRLADLHFAPTAQAKGNLLREGVSPKTVAVTGNTVIDALLYIKANKQASLPIRKLIPHGKRLILVTAHRRENFGRPLKHICKALKIISSQHSDVIIVYPIHLNPSVQKLVKVELSGVKNVFLLAPLGYVDFVKLMEQAFIILTDSGGIQEEAPSLGKPVLILRDKTERPEVVRAGCAKIVGTKVDAIIKAVNQLLSSRYEYQRMSKRKNPVGDGNASMRIKKRIDIYLRNLRSA